MLRRVADGVWIHESEFVQTNSVVVEGTGGVLLIDPGVHGDEMVCLANDLAALGQSVLAGFSTHPHWDHLLWHGSFGAPPRYGTARCATSARDALPKGIDPSQYGIPEQTPLELLGLIDGLPVETMQIPWDGPEVRIVEHQAHAPGHAALLIEDCGVLIAGDMLSDVLIPLIDLTDAVDPIEDYLAALALLESVAENVDVLVPGHGSIGATPDVRTRIDQDRLYVERLRDANDFIDPRLLTEYAKDWLPGVHAHQRDGLAQRSTHDVTRND